MKIAVIDIGSNTIHLEIFKKTRDQYVSVHSSGKVTMLGRCLTKERVIPEGKITEILSVVDLLLRRAQKKAVKKTCILATSILREAQNSDCVVKKIRKKMRINIDVLSGRREARCIEQAIRTRAYMNNKKRSLIVDIGGGSTEYICIEEGKTILLKSYAYGLSRLLAENTNKNVPEKYEKIFLEYFFKKICHLRSVLKKKPFQQLICTSSAIKSMGRMRFLAVRSDNDIDGQLLYQADIKKIQKQLLKKIHTGKRVSKRELLVFVATYFFLVLIKEFSAKNIIISSASVREGYVIGVR